MNIQEMPVGLTTSEKTKWTEDNLSPADQAIWFVAERQRNLIRNGEVKMTKEGRLVILKGQGNQCALCRRDIKLGQRICVDKHRTTIICSACNQLLAAYRKARSRGVTYKIIEQYEK